MKPTKNNWSVNLKVIPGQQTSANYFEIRAGHGFHERNSQRGFQLVGFMSADDAAILGNAKAMYDVLKRLDKQESYYNFLPEVAKVIAKIEKTFKRLEKENAKAKKAAK